MDMSYFALSTKTLKDNGLKIAVAYLYEKGRFELWLAARNREIAKQCEPVFYGKSFDGITVFHDDNNRDSRHRVRIKFFAGF